MTTTNTYHTHGNDVINVSGDHLTINAQNVVIHYHMHPTSSASVASLGPDLGDSSECVLSLMQVTVFLLIEYCQDTVMMGYSDHKLAHTANSASAITVNTFY